MGFVQFCLKRIDQKVTFTSISVSEFVSFFKNILDTVQYSSSLEGLLLTGVLIFPSALSPPNPNS